MYNDKSISTQLPVNIVYNINYQSDWNGSPYKDSVVEILGVDTNYVGNFWVWSNLESNYGDEQSWFVSYSYEHYTVNGAGAGRALDSTQAFCVK